MPSSVPPITAYVWGTPGSRPGVLPTAQAVGAGVASNAVDTVNHPFVSAFGNASGATTMSLQYSADGITWFTRQSVTLTGAGDFSIDCLCGARFLRLSTSGAVNLVAVISAKVGGG